MSTALQHAHAVSLEAPLQHCGAQRLAERARIRVTGTDRLRWLNGMVTNTVLGLAEGEWNYSFLLNAQGRIQGDANVYRHPGHLVLEMDRAQVERLIAHLDHFIIMDDVELAAVDTAAVAGIELVGPEAAAVLTRAGLPVPAPMQFTEAEWQGGTVEVSRTHGTLVAHYAIWLAAGAEPKLLQALGDVCWSSAEEMDALRVVEGIPLYGRDITDKHLAQETGQDRALNFAKGCYLGQEIVERIRSRATVHRGILQFQLAGDVPEAGSKLHLSGEERTAGELTSIAVIRTQAEPVTFALGTARFEALATTGELDYAGGKATTLKTAPRWIVDGNRERARGRNGR